MIRPGKIELEFRQETTSILADLFHYMLLNGLMADNEPNIAFFLVTERLDEAVTMINRVIDENDGQPWNVIEQAMTAVVPSFLDRIIDEYNLIADSIN